MKFDEFHEGQCIESGPVIVTESDIILFAAQWDPQWFHVDPVAAAGRPFDGPIASGWHTCAIAMRLAVDIALAGSESFASPGLEYVKWPHPVRSGDALRLRIEVLDKRRSRSRPELGILRWRWTLRNQHDAVTMESVATSMFKMAS